MKKGIFLRKISFRLAFFYSLLFSLLLVFVGAALWIYIQSYFNTQGYNQIQETAGMIVKGLGILDNQTGDSEMLLPLPSGSNIHVRIIDRHGRIISSNISSDNNIWNNNLPAETVSEYCYQNNRYFGENITYKSRQGGDMTVQIVKDMRESDDFLQELTDKIFLFLFCGIFISFLCGYLASRKMLKPIDAMTRTAKKIGESNTSLRIPTLGPEDELKRLAETFNSMLDNLEAAITRQTDFVANASHELRTPVSIIQGYASMLERWGKNDVEVLDESIAAIHRESLHMQEMIERLLLLARSDSGESIITPEPVQITFLLQEIEKEYSLLHPDFDFVLHVGDIPDYVSVDKQLLKQAIRALVDNAVKFSRPKGEICLTASSVNGSLSIGITDHGYGIPEQLREKVFERFYHTDKSDNNSIKACGLGLSIACTIAAAHNGHVTLVSQEGTGSTFTIHIPLR